MQLNRYDIKTNKLSDNWDEGMPFGNGKVGCLVYDKEGIRLAVDRIDLWDKRLNPATLEKDFNYKNLVKYSTSGKDEDWQERARLFEKVYSGLPYPSKFSAGRFEIDFKNREDKVSSRIDIKSAIGTVDLGKGSKMELFMSATKFVGVAKIYGDFDIKLHIPDYISGKDDGEVIYTCGVGLKIKDYILGYPKTNPVKDGDFIYYRQKSTTDFEYGVVGYLKNKGEYTELYFTVVTIEDYPNADFIEKTKEELLSAYNYGYEKLKKDHISWWKSYWKKSSIDLKDPMLEKTYFKATYLFASTSRKGFYPMPLQGVWTADNDSLPPWKGDYHHDTNTQLSYQSFLKANRLDEGRVFVDYLWQQRNNYKEFAKKFHKVKGLLIPGVSTIDGKPMGGWAQYSLSPTMSIWSAQSFDEYYIYSGDEKFLKTRCYPFMKGVGDAISGILEEKDGKLYLPLSTSPEIFDNWRKSYLEPNSNFDLALLRYLFITLVKYAKQLGKEQDLAKFTQILDKLDDIHVDDQGVVLLDKTQRLNETHRHFSHLMCLYPLHLINYDTEENQKIYKASLLEIERLGMGMWVGFSYGMCAQIYAMAQMGNSAYEKLWQFSRAFVAENGFHLNGDFKNYGYSTFHYRPFTLESLYAYCDSIHEMLMQDHMGYLHLFPATPFDWEDREISFKDLRTVGGVLISAKKKGNLIYGVKIKTKKDAVIKLKNVFGKNEIVLEQNGTKQVVKEENGFFTLNLKKGAYAIK